VSEIRIHVPPDLTEDRVLAFANELDALLLQDHYVVDLSAVGHVEPFGMLVCSSILRTFVRKQKERGSTFTAVGHTENSYAAHMGFYQAFGLDYGKKPGEARGGQNYLPISCVSVKALYEDAGYRPVGEAIEREAARVSKVLLQQTEGAAASRVRYALTEMMRNVVEHSYSDEIWYAGQCWPNRDCVEVAILDEGVGVRTSLRRKPKYRVNSDEEALRLAIQKGVSGVVPDPDAVRAADYDVWTNAGYGLFIVSSLCRTAGIFSIMSGDACLSTQGEQITVKPTKFSGTAVRMKLDTASPEQIDDAIQKVIPDEAASRRGKSRLPGAASNRKLQRMGLVPRFSL
jgi:hypothetical protein